MTHRTRFPALLLFGLLLSLTSCSDDGPTVSGPPDSAPPTIEAVTPVDEMHIDVRFSEPVREPSVYNFLLVEAATASTTGAAPVTSPGDTLRIAMATLKPDQRTVAIATAASMNGLTYSLSVTGVSDLHGNQVETPLQTLFTASNAPDTTPPQVVRQTPPPGAINVPVNGDVWIWLSEPVKYTNGSITWTSQGRPVEFRQLVLNSDGTFTFLVLEVDSPLPHNELQRIAVSGLKDLAGNPIVETEWSFRTSGDKTPPTIVSTSPYNLATNVSVDKNIVITFSEPIQSLIPNLQPSPGAIRLVWSTDRRTVTLSPIEALLDNQQYTMIFYPGSIEDRAGNGNATLQQTVFTTGGGLASGSIAGTIMGDPGTPSADPTGALVIALDHGGATTVAADNTYLISHLPDGIVHQVFAVFDTNGDHRYATYDGDAWGSYGMDVAGDDFFPDSVVIDNGSRAKGITFPIVDPSVIAGSFSYQGAYADSGHFIWAGLFHAATFDPDNPTPFWAEGSLDYTWRFVLQTNPFPDGDYYVGGYIDLNDDWDYTPGAEPFGMYGGLNSPTRIHIENGNDVFGIVIPVEDPLSASSRSSAASAIRWPLHRLDPKVQGLMDAIDARATRVSESLRLQ